MTDRHLAILLGPYRNLSTLTSAVLSLHPDIQVLNHAGERLWTDPQLDFLAHPDAATFERFMAAGWSLSEAGEGGVMGGSILYSHAFATPGMKELYRARYGEAMLKPDAKWLVWKESMRVQARLMASPGLFEGLCATFPDLRFILPLRNALHCAISNQGTGHSPTLGLQANASISTVLDAVLGAFAWALDMRERFPDRVFAFTQSEPAAILLPALARVLGVDADARWIEDGTKAFAVRDRYNVPPEIAAFARQQIAAKLQRWPEIAAALV
jgi:hypothetical protein